MPRVIQIATAVIPEGKDTSAGHYVYALTNEGEIFFQYLSVDGRSDWYLLPYGKDRASAPAAPA